MKFFKKIAKWLFRFIPAAIIRYTPLGKYSHHKPIPRKIKNFVLQGHGFKFNSDDGHLVRQIYWRGTDGWEKRELEYFEKLCSISSNIVEIGGNIGYFTVFGAAATSGDYTVYEPLPYNCAQLRKNLDLNGLKRVNLVQAAVVGSGVGETITFNLPALEKYGAATGGFVAGSEITDREVGYKITVDAISATKVFKNVDLVKIDAEGAEYEILLAGIEAIKDSRPIILIEVLNESILLRQLIAEFVVAESYIACVQSEKNGGIERLNANELLKVDFFEVYGTRDMTLCPEEKFVPIIGSL